MYEFSYHKPTSIESARQLFETLDEPSFLAGGHTLLPSMKQRLAAPSDLIDLSAISELSGISEENGQIVIGAMTCHDDIATSSIVGSSIPALSQLAGGIGDAQVRNRGTIGGSVSNADPAADYPAGLLGLGARIDTTVGEIFADEFFTGMFETALEDDEIVTSVSFPLPEAAAYMKFENPASRYAIVGVLLQRQAVRCASASRAPRLVPIGGFDLKRLWAVSLMQAVLMRLSCPSSRMFVGLTSRCSSGGDWQCR